MPIRSKDPIEGFRLLYQRMIDECITDIPLGGGQYRPQLNFTKLVKLVEMDPKSASIGIQLFAQAKTDLEMSKLHGTWFMMALIVAVGIEDSSVKLTRKVASDLYEAAVNKLRDVT